MPHLFDNIHVVEKVNNDNRKVGSFQPSEVAEQVINVFRSHNIPQVTRAESNHRTLFVAVGGDGTMLHTARLAAENLGCVIGFNLGRLGFLTEFSPNKVRQVIEDFILVERVTVESRLVASMEYKGNKFLALNEFFFSPLQAGLPLQLFEVKCNGHLVAKYNASGLIISTPTGSTAFAVALGGAIISPDVNVLQVVPVAPHSLTHGAHPVILSSDSTIEVTATAGNSRLGVMSDGQQFIEVFPHETLTAAVTGGTFAKFLHHPNWNFFDVLTHKMGW